MSLQDALFGAPQTVATSDDYYTPKEVFALLGLQFDLDVASPPEPIPWIPADRRYTVEDDGLIQPWYGRVWMNPPYSQATPWARKFIAHRNGVALLPFAKSAWLVEMWDAAEALVVRRDGFPNFIGGSIPYPVFFAAFGDECCEAITRLGTARRAA